MLAGTASGGVTSRPGDNQGDSAAGEPAADASSAISGALADTTAATVASWRPSIVLASTNSSAAKNASSGGVITAGGSSSGSGGGSSAPPQRVLLGCLADLRPTTKSGVAVEAGLRMALAAQKPRGVNITLLPCEDTQCGENKAKRAVRRLASQGVAAIFGDICSSSTLAAVSVSAPKGLLVISAASTSMALTAANDSFFRTVPSDAYQAAQLAALVLADGVRDAAVVYGSEAYGLGLARTFIANYQKGGGKLSVQVEAKSGAPFDGDKAAAAIVAAKPQAVVFTMYNMSNMAAVLKALHARGYKGRLYGSDSTTTELAKMAGVAAVEGMLIMDVNAGSKAFQIAFAQFTNNSISYSNKAASAYDAMTAWLAAYERAAPPKGGTQVQAALPNITFQGVSGRIAFDRNGDLAPQASVNGVSLASLYTPRVFRNGTAVPLVLE